MPYCSTLNFRDRFGGHNLLRLLLIIILLVIVLVILMIVLGIIHRFSSSQGANDGRPLRWNDKPETTNDLLLLKNLIEKNELATAVQYNIPATFLVMNDGAFGNVKRILKEDYGNRVIAANLTNPDFVKLAESFGMPGRKAASPAELRKALRESIAEPGPALVEYAAPEFPSPWPLHFRPKVRGK